MNQLGGIMMANMKEKGQRVPRKKRKEKGDEQEKQSKEYTQVRVGSDTRLPPFTITYRMNLDEATLIVSSLFCVYISQNICPASLFDLLNNYQLLSFKSYI